jgi:hypothetical protein
MIEIIFTFQRAVLKKLIQLRRRGLFDFVGKKLILIRDIYD